MTGDSPSSSGEGGADALPARASVRRNVVHMMTSQVFTWALALVTAVMVPRYLGPATQGQLRLAGSLWTVGGIFVALGTARYLRLQVARDRPEGLSLVGPVIVLRTITFLIVAATVATYALLTIDDTGVLGIFALAGVPVLIGAWSGSIEAAFAGMERMSIVAIVGAVSKVVATILVLVVIATGGSVYAILVAAVIGATVALAHYVVSFRSVTNLTLRTSRRVLARIVRGSAPFLAMTIALVVYQQIDVIAISWVAGDAVVGWYSTSELLFGSLLFPATVLVTTVFPTLGRLHQDSPVDLQGLVTRAFDVLMLIGIPMGLGVMLVAQDFTVLLYGEQFREGGQVLAVLGVVLPLTFATMLFGTVALATERNKLWVGVLSIAAAFTVPLDVFLVPWSDERFGNGALGAAFAYVVTETIQFVCGFAIVVPYLARRQTLWYVARVGAAGAVMAVVGWSVRDSALPITISLCAVVYVAAATLFRAVTDDQRRLVLDLLARVGLRVK